MKTHKRGDARGDGKIFWSRRKETGKEFWLSPEEFKRRKLLTAFLNRKRRLEHPERVREEARRSREKHREKRKATVAAWAAKNRERRKATNAEWYRRNKERLRAIRRAWEERNVEKRRALGREQDLKRRTEPRLLALKRLRLRLAYTTGRIRASKLVTRAQCKEAAEFLCWLADRQQITNLAAYHVDHLYPVACFDLSDPDQAAKSNAPENVRWLPAEENQRKADRMPLPEEVDAHLLLVKEWREQRNEPSAH